MMTRVQFQKALSRLCACPYPGPVRRMHECARCLSFIYDAMMLPDPQWKGAEDVAEDIRRKDDEGD